MKEEKPPNITGRHHIVGINLAGQPQPIFVIWNQDCVDDRFHQVSNGIYQEYIIYGF